MAHKGEALVRLAGLEAINGDGLAASGSSARKAPSGSRVAVQGKIDKSAKVGVDWTPAQRSAGTVGVTAPAQRLAEPEEDAAEPAEAPAATAEEPRSEETSVTEAAAPEAAAGAAAESGDSDLDALLASLGADEAAASTPPAEPAPGEEPAMDPDLEALLKSLG
jgi:type VI secretion system protein ImpC